MNLVSIDFHYMLTLHTGILTSAPSNSISICTTSFWRAKHMKRKKGKCRNKWQQNICGTATYISLPHNFTKHIIYCVVAAMRMREMFILNMFVANHQLLVPGFFRVLAWRSFVWMNFKDFIDEVDSPFFSSSLDFNHTLLKRKH